MYDGCQSGHYWEGSSQCSACGARLRCYCGAYVREDNLDTHMQKCMALINLSDVCECCEGKAPFEIDQWVGYPITEYIACPLCGLGSDDPRVK